MIGRSILLAAILLPGIAAAAPCPGNPDALWFLATVRFDKLNDLIEEHNEWYPTESGLPMDPRTRDYQRIRGRSYRRDPIDAEWVLHHYPAEPPT